MQEIFKLLVGIAVLILGIPIGNYLAKNTKEELKSGQNWFRLIIFAGGIGVIISLTIKNDILLFAFLFIIIVASRSLRRFRK